MIALMLSLQHAMLGIMLGIEIAYGFQAVGATQSAHHPGLLVGIDELSLLSPFMLLFARRRRLSSLTPLTPLTAKLWDRLEIEEDLAPSWYLMNCVAGLEMDLLKQCREACADLPDAIRFVVPTEKKTKSHGANRMVTESKVKFPGYVFGKLRLSSDVYERIQSLDLCRSFMGTVNQKRNRYGMENAVPVFRPVP